jgi:hypothetical protein
VWVRAEAGSKGRRDGEGEEEGRPGALFFKWCVEPLRGCMLLALWTVAMATGMMNVMLPPTVLALREAVAVVAGLPGADGT